MDALRLAHFIVTIDKALLLLCLFLGAAILTSIYIQEKLLIKRVLQLIRVKRDLRAIALKGDLEMRRVCPVIMAKTSPDDYLELTRSRSTFMPPEFAADLQRCFQASGKTEDLEKKAASRLHPKWERIQALVALGYTGDKQAFPILANALNDRDADVSYYAMLSLAQLKTNAAARALLDHGARKPGECRKIASYLETFPSAVTEELLRATYADSDTLRFWAIRVLTTFKDTACLERIIVLSKDANPEIRASSCECLGTLKGPDAEAALRDRLKDPVWFVRLHAIRSLYSICQDKAIGHLAPLKNDAHWIVRDAVAKCVSGADTSKTP